VALNHAVAISMVGGPEAGLERLARLEKDPRINTDRRFHAVRGHLLERAGDPEAALAAYTEARRRAPNVAQQRYLSRQISRLQNRT
jgi:predicted RNA polymerase sigma factor